MTTPIDKNGFAQICIIVPDIEKAAEKWSTLLGCEKPEIRELHFEGSKDFRYRDQEISCDILISVISMPGFVIELHQLLNGPSTFHEFVEKHGYGVHHIGFEVGDKRDSVIASLAEEGFDTGRTVGFYPGSSWTIVDTEDVLGVNLNIKPVR